MSGPPARPASLAAAEAYPVERFALAVEGVPVAGVLHRPGPGRAPAIVACHGLGASKDSDKYLLLAEELVAGGFALARFDFRGSGQSGGSLAGATIAGRIADLEAVIDWASAHPRLDGRVALIGSSLGGFVALWVAARRPGVPVVTWNAPASIEALGGLDPADPAAPGAALVAEVRAGRHVTAPAGVSHLLVVQGGADDVVPPEHGHQLHDRAVEPRALVVIEGADHRLSDPGHRREATARTRDWLRLHLACPERRAG